MKALFLWILTCATAAAAAPSVVPGSALAVVSDKQKVAGTGTWTSLDTSRSFPEAVNSVAIGCSRKTRQCVEAVAEVSEKNVLRVHYSELRVTAWDDREVTAVIDLSCRRETIVVNVARKIAYKTIRTLARAGCSAEDTERYKTPVMYQLEDPSPALAGR